MHLGLCDIENMVELKIMSEWSAVWLKWSSSNDEYRFPRDSIEILNNDNGTSKRIIV